MHLWAYFCPQFVPVLTCSVVLYILRINSVKREKRITRGGPRIPPPPPSDSLVSHLKGIYTLHKHFEKIYLEAYWGN